MVINQKEFISKYGPGRSAISDAPMIGASEGKRCPATPDADVRILTALIDHYKLRRCMEIGCNTGATAAAILDGNDTITKYVGIDLPEIWYDNGEAGRFAADDRFEILQLPEGSRSMDPGDLEKFDFIFIDGAHDSNSIKLDTELARKMINPGGVIAWHDYGHPGNGDVQKYIREINADNMIVHAENTWVCYEVIPDCSKIVVYTAIADDYDELKDPEHITLGVDYLCFTDSPDAEDDTIWRLMPFPGTEGMDPTRTAKHPKMLPHEFLSDYDISIWVDGNLTIKNDIVKLVMSHLHRHDITMFKHPQNRTGAKAEADACLQEHKDTPDVIRDQIAEYQQEGLPEKNPMPNCRLIGRRHNVPHIIKLDELWWDQVVKHSRRDQVSFPYAAWKTGQEFEAIDIVSDAHNPYIAIRGHKKTPIFTRYLMPPIAIMYPHDGWILERLARELLARIPESRGIEFETPGIWEPDGILNTGEQKINYFINHGAMKQKTSKTDIALFTHPEPDGKFFEIAKMADMAICLCDKYRDELRAVGVDAETIIPGVAQDFRSVLRLGFAGRANSSLYAHRKGMDILAKVKELNFVEVRETGGKLPASELQAFYDSVDYVLITSRYEGGPMCLLEALAAGKRVICPWDIGLADQFADLNFPYDNGNLESLYEVLKELHSARLKIAETVKPYTWDAYAAQHKEIFDRYITA